MHVYETLEFSSKFCSKVIFEEANFAYSCCSYQLPTQVKGGRRCQKPFAHCLAASPTVFKIAFENKIFIFRMENFTYNI
jgi:hypothetical protein